MLDNKHINAIGNFLDFSVGKGGDGHTGITYTLQGDVLTLRFSTIVHFAGEKSLRDQLILLADESMQRLKSVINGLKKDCNEQTGDLLKLKEISNNDNIELIQASSNSPRKIAYYRRFLDLQADV
ncbi:MAG: hypothetical protein CMB80_05220 [Flammeovirgaceae bacterium]|nr:hypothetical protein [Flammeovirgaceae bacterium]|tara:strand:- start:194 stop:568 length:375 start_codon:yes stop_codon:yes gene_type:complete